VGQRGDASFLVTGVRAGRAGQSPGWGECPISSINTADAKIGKSTAGGSQVARLAGLTDMLDATSACTPCVIDDLDPDSDSVRCDVLGAAMRQLNTLLQRVAPTRVPVVVSGETGSGKEGVVRRLHEASGRSGPLCILNCATIPHTLIASTLFGHERGAFTGAFRRARGAFEQAEGGTLCLDEVAELPPDAQAALLRVIESGVVTRVGSERGVRVDVRLLAASHRDLGAMVRAGTFRADLWYRLNGVTLRVPPLRERPSELRPLVLQFLREFAVSQSSAPARLESDVWFALRQHSWPGNVRELRNVIHRAAALCDDDGVVRLEHLPMNLRAEVAAPDHLGAVLDPGTSFADEIRMYEIALLREGLRRSGGCKSSAARLLRMPRRTLMRKVKLYRLG
jgi:two-component system response regulator AtoC